MHRDRFAYDITAVVLEVDLVSGSAIAMGQLTFRGINLSF